MTEVTATVEVPAPPAVVWDVLTDLGEYPRWNTLLSLQGELAVGNTVSARLSVPGLPTVRFSPEITAVEPERALRWHSRVFGIEADHAFLLEPTADGGTQFTQHEQFGGLVAGPVVRRLERRIRRGFEQMNVGLCRRAVAVRDDETVVRSSDASTE
jgi:hypothetical protein